MDVDESFAEYAAARWSTLYRLATLLTGSAEADRLTRAALVRAYPTWPDLREPATADATVRRILAATAADDPTSSPETGSAGDGAGDPPRSDRERLWEQIRMLPPRQRVVLVLRHYELFSDGEIAGALHGSPDTVAVELLTLERGIDLDELREELRRRSDETVVPHPPLDAILAAGHAERRHRRARSWRRGAVAAAVLALVLLVANIVDDAGGRTSTQPREAAAGPVRSLALLPEGEAPRIAYALGRSLHLAGGAVVRLDDVSTGILQTKKWLYVAYLSGAIIRIDPATADE
jgi:DNA-directed RNA polymerase specialized sigma24 family protein